MMTDILVIGSGGAGLSAAYSAKANSDCKVTVLSKSSITSAQTSQAQGGINAVLSSTVDSTEQHIQDTVKSANSIGNEANIRLMCEKAPDAIKWLDDLAVAFSKDEEGNIKQRKLGGATNARACYSSDYTGLKILHTLYDSCRKVGVEFLEDYFVLDLIVENNEVCGVVVFEMLTSQIKQILAKKVIIASGGYAGIYVGHNTNSSATTAEMITIANKAGCELKDMEFVQFHPTSLEKNSVLISESARGEGGYLVDESGNRFIDELKPRDEVARAIYEKRLLNQKVYLDLRHLGKEKILNVMPQEYELAYNFCGLKMDEDLIPIKPAAHYTMGGIKVDENGKTNIKNLYAVGECANNGVHGANRLGGNSLLEIVVFGKIAADDAIKSIEETKLNKKEYPQYQLMQNNIEQLFEYNPEINFYEYKDSLGDMMYANVGLYRDKQGLQNMLKFIDEVENKLPKMGIIDKNKTYNTNLKEFYEFKQMVNLAKIITTFALQREQSLGAHYRTDCQGESI